MDRSFPRVYLPVAAALIVASSAVVLAASSTSQPGTDAVVVYDRPPPTFGKAATETHYTHSGKTRIDMSHEDKRQGLRIVWQQFTRPGQKVKLSVGRDENARILALSVMDDALVALPPVSERKMTGSVESHLGENCNVWRVERQGLSKSPFVQSGCTSKDGIELWRRQANIDAIFASSISRRPVEPEEVRIPYQAFDIDTWLTRAKRQDHSHDFEAILQGEGRSAGQLIQRRSGDWHANIEEGANSSLHMVVWNPVEGIVILYSRSKKGERQLSIRREPPERMPMQQPYGVGGEREEWISGEVCRWWNTMPNVSDAGQKDCITDDGIILASNRMSWGTLSSSVLTKLKRSPMPLSKILPGEEILSRAAWGL